MKKWIRQCLFKFFGGFQTTINSEILQTLHKSKPLTCQIVKHYFCGGSYKAAQIHFFISEATYYRHIQNFIKNLEKMIKF